MAGVPPRRRALLKCLLLLCVTLPGACAGCSTTTEMRSSQETPAEWEVVKLSDPSSGGKSAAYISLDFVTQQHGWVACTDTSDAAMLWGPAAGPGGWVLRTVDGGISWREEKVASLVVDFVDSDTGWLVGEGRAEVWRTVNGGTWWDATAGRFSSITDIAAVSAEEAWLIAGHDLIHTTDAGASWTVVPHPLASNPTFLPLGLLFLDQSTGWVIGELTGGMGTLPIRVLFTVDGGKTFGVASAPSVPTGNSLPFGLDFTSRAEGWAAVGGPSLLHTLDGGKTWAAVTPAVDEGTFDGALYDCSFLDKNNGWVVGSTGTFGVGGETLAITTSDGGRTWQRSLTGMEDIVHGRLCQVVFVDAGHGWAVGDGGQWPSDFPVPQKGSQVYFLLRYLGERGSTTTAPGP